jgi:hypothetical protein
MLSTTEEEEEKKTQEKEEKKRIGDCSRLALLFTVLILSLVVLFYTRP